MGLAMANNLQRHLVAKRAPAMLYNNRRLARGKPLQELGGVPTKSFENVVKDCGVIFTMVFPLPPVSRINMHMSRYLERNGELKDK